MRHAGRFVTGVAPIERELATAGELLTVSEVATFRSRAAVIVESERIGALFGPALNNALWSLMADVLAAKGAARLAKPRRAPPTVHAVFARAFAA